MLCIATRWETSYEFLLGVHMHHYIPNCDYYQENVWSQFIMLPNMCSIIERKPAKLGQWHKFYNSHIFGENVLDICTCFHVLYLCLRYFSAHALDNLVVTSREKSFLVAKIFLLSDFLFPHFPLVDFATNLVKDYFFWSNWWVSNLFLFSSSMFTAQNMTLEVYIGQLRTILQYSL